MLLDIQCIQMWFVTSTALKSGNGAVKSKVFDVIEVKLVSIQIRVL